MRTLLFGPLHGHGIAEHIQRTSEEILQVEHGSLYPALHRLEKSGSVASKSEQTDRGREILERCRGRNVRNGRALRRAFGNVTRTQADVRAVWTRRWAVRSRVEASSRHGTERTAFGNGRRARPPQ